MGKMDNEMKGAKSRTGATPPKAAGKADMSGEKMGKIVGGVAQGKEDNIGMDKEFNTGKTSGVCYTHVRNSYGQ